MDQPWNLKEDGIRERLKRLPPFAPSISEKQVYEKYVKTKKGNALVLGVTPELRDIVIKNGLISYAVDLSKVMFERFNPIMNFKNHKNNISIVGNWLDMDFDDAQFSVVLGNAPFTNLATMEDNLVLIKKISQYLQKHGFLVLRKLVDYQPEEVPTNILVEKYRNDKILFSDFFMHFRFYQYRKYCYSEKTYQLNSKKVFELIKKEYANGEFNKQEFNAIMAYENNIVNTLPPQDKFISMVENEGFKLVEIFEDPKYNHTKYLKMIVFEKV